MTKEQIIEIIKLEAHKNLIIVDEGTDSYNDYVIRGVDLMAESLAKLLATPLVINCTTCQHEAVSKYVEPCHGCNDHSNHQVKRQNIFKGGN